MELALAIFDELTKYLAFCGLLTLLFTLASMQTFTNVNLLLIRPSDCNSAPPRTSKPSSYQQA